MTQFIDTSKWGALYPDRATLQSQSAGAKNERGVAVVAWNDVAGLTNLACNKEMKGGDEIPGIEGAIAVSTHTITFQSYHASITEKMRCVIDGITYNILLADSDPMKVCSILKAKKVIG